MRLALWAVHGLSYVSSETTVSEPHSAPANSMGKSPIPTIHVTDNISQTQFEEVVAKGVPTVFRGVASSWNELLGLSCSDFSARWPNASMRAEYTGSPESETFLKLGDSQWMNQTKAPRGINSPSPDCDDDTAKDSRPHVSPFVWHVKDRVKRSIKEDIASMMKGFTFVKPGSVIDAHMRDSMEFWFQHVGAGTFAHNDGYCHSVFSVQLRGSKKWRLMVAPEVTDLARDVFDEFDSGIYNSVHKWDPEFDVVLNAGDGVIFPPGFMHETKSVEGPSSEDQCATSVTFNIPLPMPSVYVREYLPRFSVSREIHHCMRRWESFVTAKTALVDWDVPFANSTSPAMIANDILAMIDLDKDGEISLREVDEYFMSAGGENFKNQRSMYFGDLSFSFDPARRMTPDMIREALRIRARDTLAMWDVNGDGTATLDEIRDVVEYFHFYRWRQQVVDSVLQYKTAEGEVEDIPIGSDMFKYRLGLVDELVHNVRADPPTLNPGKYPVLHRTDRVREEL